MFNDHRYNGGYGAYYHGMDNLMSLAGKLVALIIIVTIRLIFSLIKRSLWLIRLVRSRTIHNSTGKVLRN
jgi:hypothetical protein